MNYDPDQQTKRNAEETRRLVVKPPPPRDLRLGALCL